MTTHVLEVKFIDATESIDKEFNSLEDVVFWLNGQRESDFDWLSLHDNNTDMVIEGWSDILRYLHENTIVAINTGTCPQCSHGKGFNCPLCWPAKSSCIAQRSVGMNIPCVATPDTTESVTVPILERFIDLPEGTLFYLAQTYAYGGNKKLIKTLKDGGPHNAVYNEYGGIGIQLRDEQLVFRA